MQRGWYPPPQTPAQPTKNQRYKNKQTSPLNELPQVALTSYHNSFSRLTITLADELP